MGGTSDFKASSGWLKNFKLWHSIRELNIEGEILLCNSKSAEKFMETFLNMIKWEGYTRNNIYNADGTGINWKDLPWKSLASCCESPVLSYKVSKDRINVMICANASEDHVLPLLVIRKAIKPRCFKNVNQIPVTYKAQKSIWMNSEWFYEWYSNEFIPKVKQKQECKRRKVMLLLDNASSPSFCWKIEYGRTRF